MPDSQNLDRAIDFIFDKLDRFIKDHEITPEDYQKAMRHSPDLAKKIDRACDTSADDMTKEILQEYLDCHLEAFKKVKKLGLSQRFQRLKDSNR